MLFYYLVVSAMFFLYFLYRQASDYYNGFYTLPINNRNWQDRVTDIGATIAFSLFWLPILILLAIGVAWFIYDPNLLDMESKDSW